MSQKIDRIGQRFSRLVVTGCEGQRTTAGGNKVLYWVCKCDCGNEVSVQSSSLVSGKQKSCGCWKREQMGLVGRMNVGSKSPRYTGGRHTTPEGYVKVLGEREPGKTTYYSEHRIIMEQHLGRKLYEDESIHHKNGIRNDNRIENLELRASNHGQGQTIDDLLVWAKEIIRRYGS